MNTISVGKVYVLCYSVPAYSLRNAEYFYNFDIYDQEPILILNVEKSINSDLHIKILNKEGKTGWIVVSSCYISEFLKEIQSFTTSNNPDTTYL
jgi:hypothetical protein